MSTTTTTVATITCPVCSETTSEIAESGLTWWVKCPTCQKDSLASAWLTSGGRSGQALPTKFTTYDVGTSLENYTVWQVQVIKVFGQADLVADEQFLTNGCNEVGEFITDWMYR